MKPALSILIFLILLSCNNKSQRVASDPNPGGSCEGCEAIFESPVPHEQLPYSDTLPDYFEPGPKMVLYGIAYQPDGKTPAPGVVIYAYHTDQQGLYSKGQGSTWAQRHGYIRSWVKTNANGEYRMYTLRPAPYPNSNAAAHIHLTIKEPGKREYYIDEVIFTDDRSEEIKNHNFPNRGGPGLINVENRNGIQWANRPIYLGRNIPGYK